MITDGTIQIDQDLLPVLDLIVIGSSEESVANNLEFTWVATEMTERTVKFQLLFKTAMYVSAEGE